MIICTFLVTMTLVSLSVPIDALLAVRVPSQVQSKKPRSDQDTERAESVHALFRYG